MNSYIMVTFNIAYLVADLMIRIVPIYADAGFFTTPVKRCPHHVAPTDPLNQGTLGPNYLKIPVS